MRRLLPLLLLLLLLAGCKGQPQAHAPVRTPPPTPEPVPTPDPVAAQVAAMTDEELAGQLLIVGIPGTELTLETVRLLQDCRPGGVILFRQNVESAPQLATLTNGLKGVSCGGVPLLLCVDEEGGPVSRMPHSLTDLPPAHDFLQSGGDPYALGTVLAAQCAAFGFHLDFAPVLDIWSNPANRVIGSRALGTDAPAAAAAGAEMTQGLADGGIIPVGKHFPGHGDTTADSHTSLPIVDRSREELEARELIPFRRAMEEGIPALMVAHLLLPQLDPDLPASLSPAVVGLLREELGFQGVIFTDDLAMGAISQRYTPAQAALQAIQAGCDMALVCHGTDKARSAYKALLNAIQTGELDRRQVEGSVCRILTLKQTYRVDAAPVPMPDVDGLNAQIQSILP